MTHRIGIIGGDGIGPEVIAEALKVVDATGVAYDAVDVRPRRRPLPAHRRGAARRRPRRAARLRRDPARRGRHPRRAARACSSAACCSSMRFELDLYINLRPFLAPASDLNDGVDMVVIRENTEGTYAGEGGFLRKGTPHEVATQGSVNTRFGRRALRPLRVRPRAQSGPRRHLTLVHKTNVLTFAGDLWQRDVQRGGGRVPRRHHRLRPHRRGVHPLRPAARALRRDRHRQPVRRHPHRPRRRDRRRDRPGRVRPT